jgi:hypothetical protein
MCASTTYHQPEVVKGRLKAICVLRCLQRYEDYHFADIK